MIRTINGKDYTFIMTRKGIREAEAKGFKISSFADAPMTAVTYLWYAELYASTKMAFDKAEELLDDYLDEHNDFTELARELTEDYSEFFK